jgi:putative FmdB family regulatory protein
MPIYEYQCEKCGTQIDLMQKIGEPAPKKCESCGAKGKMSRQVSRTSFVLKGGGWYSDLYGSAKKADAGKTETPKSDSAKSESKTETKTETKKEAKADSGGDKGGSSSGGSSSPASSSGSGGGSPPASGSAARAGKSAKGAPGAAA